MNIERLQVQVRMQFPWWAVIANLLDWEIDNSIDTACTNGRWVKFNESFMDSMSEDEQLFVVLHELTHIALKHHLRRGTREHSRFNIAADHRINLELKGTKGVRMPACGLADPQYTGLTEYEIYELLADKPEDKPEDQESGDSEDESDDNSDDSEGSDSDSDESDEPGESESESGDNGDSDESEASSVGMGDVVDGDDGSMTEAELQEMEKEIDQAIQLADNLSTMAGKGGGLLGEIARSAREPEIDWRKPLRRWVTNEFPSFRSYRRVDRRWLAAGVVWPGVEKQNQTELVFALDCSSSMSRQKVAQLSREVESAFQQADLATVHILYFTDGVHIHETYKRGQKFKELSKFPSGGTCFDSLFEYIVENCPKAKAAIVMTDGYDEFPAKPKMNVLWAMTTGIVPPFGEVLKVS